MEDLFIIIAEYASLWTPALVATLGIIVTVLTTISKLNEALKTLKADTTLSQLKSDLKRISEQNEELVKCNKLLLDQITKIQGYADHKE